MLPRWTNTAQAASLAAVYTLTSGSARLGLFARLRDQPRWNDVKARAQLGLAVSPGRHGCRPLLSAGIVVGVRRKRRGRPLFGCLFLRPVSDSAVVRVPVAFTVVQGGLRFLQSF
ncbi:hypothetical protein MRX96_044350 [Rhipicephalus microplus]